MFQVAVYGRLGGDVKRRMTRTDKRMALGNLAVEVPDRTQGAEEGAAHTLWIGVVAFGRVAEALARGTKGECVAVCGRLQQSGWLDRSTGEIRQGWQVLADSVVCASGARPGAAALGGWQRPAGVPAAALPVAGTPPAGSSPGVVPVGGRVSYGAPAPAGCPSPVPLGAALPQPPLGDPLDDRIPF